MATSTTKRAPARAGDGLAAVDTPALLVDLAAFDANLAVMAQRAAQAGVRLRPHAKAHKSLEIARRQMAAGAVGVCCQKVSEAEVFVRGGIPDVLVSNQVVGARKLDRLALLARTARIAVCVDHPVQVAQLAAAARKRAVRIDVLIEVDVGQGRCGVPGPDEAVALWRLIGAHPNELRLRGLQAYQGRAQHLRDPQQRRDAINHAAVKAVQVRRALQADGATITEITGGGTGSYVNELDSGIYTEIQPGSYVLMDADYGRNQNDERDAPLRQVIHVLATVITVHGDRAVLDAGLKALSAECGPPLSAEPGWRVASISDEHVVLRRDAEPASSASAAGLLAAGMPAAAVSALVPPARSLAPGDKVRLVPSHCDPTVNLHDWYVALDGDKVDAIWPVDARGAVF
ncbi:MAG: DSD1 family PLP-dependent enzyme [Burkholderiaceae bacterium]